MSPHEKLLAEMRRWCEDQFMPRDKKERKKENQSKLLPFMIERVYGKKLKFK